LTILADFETDFGLYLFIGALDLGQQGLDLVQGMGTGRSAGAGKAEHAGGLANEVPGALTSWLLSSRRCMFTMM